LKENGYIDCQNVRIEYRWARGAYERLPALALELVDLRVAVIATIGTSAVRIAKDAAASVTPAIPVVFSIGSDPVAEGLVASFNLPGGHVTGVTSIAAALGPKRLELVRELLGDKAVAILINPANPLGETEKRETEIAAQALGLQIEVLTGREDREIEMAFTGLERRRIGVLILAVDTFFYTRMRRMAALAAQYRVPVIGPLREFAAEGGLMSYGTSIGEVNRQVGMYVAKVLKGSRPADLPVLQPTKFELVINLKTAKTLGLEVPPTLLARADEAIE
jgi:putative ABC transport system substrate-binding protein